MNSYRMYVQQDMSKRPKEKLQNVMHLIPVVRGDCIEG